MLFSDHDFWIFFVAVFLALRLNARVTRSVSLQNSILLTASYFFYAYWDWRFLALIILISAQTFAAGSIIQKSRNYRKFALYTSTAINLSTLFYFKYFNFFTAEFISAFGFGESYSFKYIVLPVGISFYIFQTFTYVLDIYKGSLSAEKNALPYFTFVAFFPQLVAGPIERASNLLPQFEVIRKSTPDEIYLGIKAIIIGLFMKICVADSLAFHVDEIFAGYNTLGGGTLALGAVGFSIQIYADFAGYSIIAIGVARIMGFNLMTNFKTPYFATSIQDFWRRWHISLSTFFRDYVYIPLGGSRLSNKVTARNLLITFGLSGLWHGANWTFIFWGILHGVSLVIHRHTSLKTPAVLGWIATMSIVFLLWIFFSIADY